VGVESAQRFFRGNRTPARLGVAGQLVSAAALVGLTAQVLRRAGGSTTMRRTAAAGGALAAATLAVSAGASAALTGSPGDDKNTARVLHRVVFLSGGPAHNVGLGLLIGAASVAGRQSSTVPRGLVNGGFGAGTAACLSPISLVSTPAMVAIPLGRLSCLVVGALAGRRLGAPMHGFVNQMVDRAIRPAYLGRQPIG
jgi:hypothetical protein